ncbi:MAG TPA: gfo/Idh/MocA family oxidoreductase [Planctomycetes bacterium]|nr:gfo/Idh/MocA family oxidoreductase [Planctomycetota bacterium]
MLNIAVVGCGYWGPNHIRNFRTVPECRVTKVCDLDKKRLAHMQSLYPEIETSTDFDLLVSDPVVNALVVATSTSTHYPLAKKALAAGKHVLIEKPMASSVKQCRELLDLATRHRLTIMVGHTFVYSAPVRKIKQLIDAGELGEIRHISSSRLNLGLFQKDINVAWDLAPHDISIIDFFLGKDPIAVNCQGKAHVTPGIEDVTNMSLDFENGAFATIQSSWLHPNKTRIMAIVGSKKMAVYDDNEPLEKVKVYDKRVEVPPHYDTFADFHYSYHYGDMYAPHLSLYEPLKVEAQQFVECVRTGASPDSGGRHGLKVVQVLEAASRSLKKGGARIAIADDE